MSELHTLAMTVMLAVVLLPLLAGCGGAATVGHSGGSAPNSVSFPENIYPPARPLASGTSADQNCASPAGVVAHPAASVTTFVRLLNKQLDAASLPGLLVHMDRAVWPNVITSWAPGRPRLPRGRYVAADIQVVPLWAHRGAFTQFINNACGHALVDGSWMVSYCSPGTRFSLCDPGVSTSSLVLQRSGTWLTWYQSAGYQG